MARFYAKLDNGQGRAIKMGDGIGGIWGHIHGEAVGIEVICRDGGGYDVIDVYLTGGSRAGVNRRLIGQFTKGPSE